MLIDKDTVVKAMSLDVKGLTEVLNSSGYTTADGEVLTCKFEGIVDNCQFQYAITYREGGFEEADGFVYVSVFTDNGKAVLKADY